MIPHRTVEQIKDMAAANIVQIIGEYVSLRRSGASYKGCCPFHSEKTPSFNVNPARGTYYCFGCHEHGNAIGFIMKQQNISFPDALRVLGRRFGIDVRDEGQTPEQAQAERERDRQLSTMEFATRTFVDNLRDTQEGQTQGLAYLRSRGFRDDTIATFRLGYSINNIAHLTNTALNSGFSIEALTRCGLTGVYSETRQAYDIFRGRVMFPIHNASGKVIAFGARVTNELTDGDTPKYINTGETALYSKAAALFGLHQAKQEITKKGKCYIVGSPTDVITLYQSGVRNVVATCGTALTAGQLRLVRRFCSNITLLIGSNPDSRAAALSNINIILAEGMNVSIIILPDGQDPDSFARSHTPEVTQEYVAKHEIDFVRFEAETLMANCCDDPAKTDEAANTIAASIVLVKDETLRELYVQQCIRVTGLTEESVLCKLEEVRIANANLQRMIQQQTWRNR